MPIRYPAVFEPQKDGSFLVTFVDLPDTFMEGATLEEAIFNGVEVLTGMLAAKIDDNHDIPRPTKMARVVKGQTLRYLAPDAKTQAALLMRWARGTRATMSDVARSLETSWPAAKRLEDPHHSPNLARLDKAAAILGKRLVLSFEDT